MSRLVGTPSSARRRTRLVADLSRALDACSSGGFEPGEQADLLAYLRELLKEVVASVELTALAWEKRSYWLKADRFRREWGWAERAYQGVATVHDRGGTPLEAQHLVRSLRELTPPALASRKRQRPWLGAAQAWARGHGPPPD